MKTRAIRTSKDKTLQIIEGNKEIGWFMGDINAKAFQDSYYWIDQPYHQSWDALMTVITKIKTYVFKDGAYDMFSAEHFFYKRIGDACYDADLYSAWDACVYWISLFYHHDNVVEDQFTAITSAEFLTVADHAVIRFKERIMDMPTKTIKKILSCPELLEKYKEKGDGEYLIPSFGHAVCRIKEYRVVTVINKEEDAEDIMYNGKKIA